LVLEPKGDGASDLMRRGHQGWGRTQAGAGLNEFSPVTQVSRQPDPLGRGPAGAREPAPARQLLQPERFASRGGRGQLSAQPCAPARAGPDQR
jgi:hypothetical protein